MASVPEITRMIARIEHWKEERGKARGRADTDRVLGEAHKPFEEIGSALPYTSSAAARRVIRAAFA